MTEVACIQSATHEVEIFCLRQIRVGPIKFLAILFRLENIEKLAQ